MWLYQLQKLSLNQTPKPEFTQDKIILDLGTLCGLSEDVMTILCDEVGSLKKYKGGETVMQQQNQDDLDAAFKTRVVIGVEISELDR